ncbi:hypothetical protein [Alishewanella phage vB_AspM_Slickus01]|nr:hypothetical protein [Alishewanella phage vB_AspM_Slickus01]
MMNMSLQNLTSKSKRMDRFYVTFFGLPENISNVVGRQVTTITRPEVGFDTLRTTHRRNTYVDVGKVTLQPINITFKDDEESITSMFLYAQIMRQLNQFSDIFGDTNNEEQLRKFGIKVEFMNANDKITESYHLKDCIITAISHSDPTTGDDDDTDMNVTIEYDNLDVKIFDTFMTLSRG